MVHVCSVCGNEEPSRLSDDQRIKAFLADINEELQYARKVNPQMAMGMILVRDKFLKRLERE